MVRKQLKLLRQRGFQITMPLSACIANELNSQYGCEGYVEFNAISFSSVVAFFIYFIIFFIFCHKQHHCRNCGKVVCGPCSSKKFLLPQQSTKPLRVCLDCYDSLSRSKNEVRILFRRTMNFSSFFYTDFK